MGSTINRSFSAAFLLLIALIAASPASAQNSQATSFGLDFLNIAPNATTLSLAEAYTASLNGSVDIYTNPASLAMENSSYFSANYTAWLADFNHSHVSASFKSGKNSYGIGIISLNSSDFEARNQPGPSQGVFSVGFLSVAGAYARQIANFSVGVTAHFLNENYLNNQASGYGFNFGVSSHWLNKRVRVAATIQNVGEMDELNEVSTELPTNLRGGIYADVVEFTTPGRDDLPILVSLQADVVKPLVDDIDDSISTYDLNDLRMHFGSTINFAELIDLRVGYLSGESARNWSLGAGFHINSIRFNYAYLPLTTGYNDVHSLGLEYAF